MSGVKEKAIVLGIFFLVAGAIALAPQIVGSLRPQPLAQTCVRSVVEAPRYYTARVQCSLRSEFTSSLNWELAHVRRGYHFVSAVQADGAMHAVFEKDAG